MNRTILKTLGVAILLLVAPRDLPARLWCTNTDFAGSYSILGIGTITQAPPGAPILGPTARMGRLTAFADGRLEIRYTRGSYGGFIFEEPFEGGTFTVNPDCTINILFNFPAPINLPVAFQGVIANDVTQVRGMTLIPGVVLTVATRRQRIAGCTAAELLGEFQIELNGSVLGPPPQGGPVTLIGRLVSHGQGAFTLSTTTNFAGLPVADNTSGTYTLDAECKLNLTFTSNTPAGPLDFRIEGVMTDRKNAQLLLTRPYGVVLAGSLKLQ